jgi:type IV pilus assembly protein PilO
MPDLRDTRRKIKTVLIALGVINVAALGVLFSPLVGSEHSRHDQLESGWKELQQKTKQVGPLRGMDKKIVSARQQIERFYKDRLPERDSEILEAMGRVAKDTGVKIDQMRYTPQEAPAVEAVGLREMDVEASLNGNYLQLVKFINALERDQVFFIVDSVQLGGEQAGQVRLQIKVETYLKSEA